MRFMWQRQGVLCAFVACLAGCTGEVDDHGALDDTPGTPDATATPDGAPATPDADVGLGLPLLRDGANSLSATGGTSLAFQLDTVPGEHVSVQLTFAGGSQDVELVIERDGDRVGSDEDGSGLRTLALLDQRGPGRFAVKVVAGETVSGTLTVVRTPFTDGKACLADCARLLQMPLANDPLVDGYDVTWGIKRYQFGRRDLLMFVREAGRQRAARGAQPFYPEDFSAWDGRTPGLDVGSARHASHQRGKDVDLSLYGLDGKATWRSFCTVQYVDGDRVCKDGTASPSFDAYQNAIYFLPFFETGRMTYGFLDRELIEKVRPAAAVAKNEGAVPAAMLPLYSDGKHLQHWPFHDNHIHVRVSESDYGAREGAPLPDEPFEAP
jgi:hypothetical protein